MMTTAEEARVVPKRRGSRWIGHVLVFAAAVLLANAIFGERGLLQSTRARRAYTAAWQDLKRVRQENVRLRDEIRRLRSDPSTIEAVAREELGLARPGEIVVTVRDLARQKD